MARWRLLGVLCRRRVHDTVRAVAVHVNRAPSIEYMCATMCYGPLTKRVEEAQAADDMEPLLLLAILITASTNLLLQAPPFMMAVSLVTMLLLTFAISSLALGFGALYPRFDTENAAHPRIPEEDGLDLGKFGIGKDEC
jgi:hypothetical protein